MAGCATGEEAYSIAMILREALADSDDPPRLQLFASDIDEDALQFARTGRYPAVIERDVSAERLERFFLKEDGTYRVRSSVREICVFAHHSVLRDPPFSRMHLISCRNLLIYLSRCRIGSCPCCTTPCSRAATCSSGRRRTSGAVQSCSTRSTRGSASSCAVRTA